VRGLLGVRERLLEKCKVTGILWWGDGELELAGGEGRDGENCGVEGGVECVKTLAAEGASECVEGKAGFFGVAASGEVKGFWLVGREGGDEVGEEGGEG
jgi:hypothetical protein